MECREAGTRNQTNERRNRKAVDVSDSGIAAIAEYKKQMERFQCIWRNYSVMGDSRVAGYHKTSQQSKESIRSIGAAGSNKRALSAPHERGYSGTHIASSKLRTALDP